MVLYECYDEYGNKIVSINHQTENFKAIILEHNGKYYRPICYQLDDGNIAKCCPVEVIRIKSGERV